MKRIIILIFLICCIDCRGEDLGIQKDCSELVNSTILSLCLPVYNNSSNNKVDADFYINVCLLRLLDAHNCK